MKANETLPGGMNHRHKASGAENNDVAFNVEKGSLARKNVRHQDRIVGFAFPASLRSLHDVGSLKYLDSLAFVNDNADGGASMDDGMNNVATLTRVFIAISWKDSLEVLQKVLLLEKPFDLRRNALFDLFLEAPNFLSLVSRFCCERGNSTLVRGTA